MNLLESIELNNIVILGLLDLTHNNLNYEHVFLLFLVNTVT